MVSSYCSTISHSVSTLAATAENPEPCRIINNKRPARMSPNKQTEAKDKVNSSENERQNPFISISHELKLTV